MAKCGDCGQEMTKANSCTVSSITIDGKTYERSWEHFNEGNGRCHDCGIKHGGYHHLGCDVERCPKCGGQLISCGCLEEEEG
jgi:hypothetical protein